MIPGSNIMTGRTLSRHRSKSNQVGFMLTTELVLLTTTLIIGSIVGLTSIRDALNAELIDVSNAINAANHSYAFDGYSSDQNTSGSGLVNPSNAVYDFSFTPSDFTEGDSSDSP